ncbi:ArsR/SmtB family transcription factor [Streptomyces marispadix]|uniref:Helix-turn-helix domain-containing protein n=1 Tax=Streptomyces marispadix TaxID=2922868 RepID=A0ABS9SUY9_9ACTN|nr:helix-turn-helix domain-containing protein [Streptomyces marispadix]MCH6160090.1 helix-turn-helix domain-containing protein [Streptomyces marispadix]
MAGALRIHFTDRDFRHVQLARSADPMWEAILGLHVLTTSPAGLPARLRPWRRRARERLRGGSGSELRSACRLLSDLAPADAAYFPDFLTPTESEEGLAAALSTLRATPGARLARELREAARYRPLPSWTRRLAAGDRTLLGSVADAVHEFHTRLIVPDWSEVEATIAADRAWRLEALEAGIEGVLTRLTPFVWREPVLTAPYPVDQDLHLKGRGLRLVLSFFCHTRPIAIADPNLPPVVVCPVRRQPEEPGIAARPSAALAALLGTGRARVLAALTATFTTGSVAARLNMPASTVSGHLKVLRDAGLVRSERAGTHVVHRLTAVSRQLLGR